MALIPCPECDQKASDRARACPHCGFPIAEEIERSLATVTGHDRIRSARQLAAANKLRTWSERYAEGEHPRRRVEAGEGIFERYKGVIFGVIVIVVVSLQLYLLYVAVYE